MKALAFLVSFIALGAMAQAPGPSYTVVVSWSEYTNPAAAGFKIYIAPRSGAYGGDGSKTFVVTNSSATNFTFTIAPGGEYKAKMTAFTAFGLESAPTEDILWHAPASIPAPTGFRPSAIIYVP